MAASTCKSRDSRQYSRFSADSNGPFTGVSREEDKLRADEAIWVTRAVQRLVGEDYLRLAICNFPGRL